MDHKIHIKFSQDFILSGIQAHLDHIPLSVPTTMTGLIRSLAVAGLSALSPNYYLSPPSGRTIQLYEQMTGRVAKVDSQPKQPTPSSIPVPQEEIIPTRLISHLSDDLQPKATNLLAAINEKHLTIQQVLSGTNEAATTLLEQLLKLHKDQTGIDLSQAVHSVKPQSDNPTEFQTIPKPLVDNPTG